jgi:tRNA A37 threonylcarbamoyladenosine dehydratase
MGLVGVGGVGDWELEALKELHGARWDIRKVHAT